MIDFMLGASVASAFWWFATQTNRTASPGAPGLTAAILEGLRTIMTQTAQDIIAQIDAALVKIAAANNEAAQVADLQSQLQAEKDAHAADLAAIATKAAELGV